MIHFLGKDILKFHSIYWPAILELLKESQPEKLIVHHHWLNDNKKMSKSFGNIINPYFKNF